MLKGKKKLGRFTGFRAKILPFERNDSVFIRIYVPLFV